MYQQTNKQKIMIIPSEAHNRQGLKRLPDQLTVDNGAEGGRFSSWM